MSGRSLAHWDWAEPEDREPWTQHEVECNACGYRWRLVRMVKHDFRDCVCPRCQAQDSDLPEGPQRDFRVVH